MGNAFHKEMGFRCIPSLSDCATALTSTDEFSRARWALRCAVRRSRLSKMLVKRERDDGFEHSAYEMDDMKALDEDTPSPPLGDFDKRISSFASTDSLFEPLSRSSFSSSRSSFASTGTPFERLSRASFSSYQVDEQEDEHAEGGFAIQTLERDQGDDDNLTKWPPRRNGLAWRTDIRLRVRGEVASMTDEFVHALGSIRVWAPADEACVDDACGEASSAGSTRGETGSAEERYSGGPPVLRRQNKIRRLSPTDLLAIP